ncbi:MalY/PatB family protein [uncultured Prevotella sp.]|uniref:MalY/PatB family protein n=1 Tax=uncultured Prevotella sp. TaxID=159272 RepID=UPI00258E602D|nr:MalY/PatB family protein [uncultured Prevotella sp.]
MKYDFDKITPRCGTNSYKWDSTDDKEVLPMWVADMDFPTAPCIINALEKRVEHGIFGYTRVPEEYYDAVISWFSRRHHWKPRREWFIYTSGVVPALSAVIKALTNVGDKVLTLTPVYNCFFSSIRNNGCELDSCALRYEDNTFSIDYEDLERRAADPKTTLMLLCNPHNPSGRVWTREELRRIGDICIKNNVVVVADEIHCELVHPGFTYTPFASVSEEFQKHSVTCVAPSKAFNIAGLQIANIIVENDKWRQRIDKAININEVCDVNPFGVIATIAAYNEGEEWLNQLLQYIHGNYLFFKDYCEEHLPQLPVAPLEGTYLAWMDCRSLGIPSEELEEELMKEAKLWLNAGSMYGKEGEGFMRWNLACPRQLVKEGLERFSQFVDKR